MDGYTWERRTWRNEETGRDYDEVDISDDFLGLTFITVPVERFAEFAAWVAAIARALEGVVATGEYWHCDECGETWTLEDVEESGELVCPRCGLPLRDVTRR